MGRRRKESKAKTQARHTKTRAQQRFGMGLSNETLEGLVRQIQSGKGRCIERQSLRVTIWEVDLQGLKVAVAYDKTRKSIATVMPMKWWVRDVS